MLGKAVGEPEVVQAGLYLASVLTPSAPLGATEADYTPSGSGLPTASVLRLTACPGGGTLSGLAAPLRGQLLLVCNISQHVGDVIVLLRDDPSSTAANRFLWGRTLGPSLSGPDVTELVADDVALATVIAHRVRGPENWGLTAAESLTGPALVTDRPRVRIVPADGMVWLWYDLASARWRLLP